MSTAPSARKNPFTRVVGGAYTNEPNTRPQLMTTLTIGAVAVQALVRPFSVAEYDQLITVGVLNENDQCELIEGEIIEMSPIGVKHAACVNRLNTLVNQRAALSVIVSIQNPIRLNDYSEPQPDVLLLRHRKDFYSERLPEPHDVLLLVEVSDTTLEFDRLIKLPLYARNGIVEVWLVNLEDKIVEVYTQPAENGYQSLSRARRGKMLSPQQAPQLRLAVDEILG